MATEHIPVVDLRLLSQTEINTLSVSCPNAFDLHRCDDVVVPKIDRSVFNESAGSRKQTYSRLRLAPRKPDGPPSSASSSSSVARRGPRGLLSSSPSSSAASAADGGANDDDPGRRENQQIVSFLRQLFAREESSAPHPQLQSQTLSLTVATPVSARRNSDADDSSRKALVVVEDRDRDVLNAKGVTVDLVGLGEKVDPFGEELRRRTAGLKTEVDLLRFLSALEGQWGSRRKRRKIVDASVFGDDLPRGWKLLLGLKRKEGVAWVNCRRYVSPNGKQFGSCKEVSSYILSLVGHPNNVKSIFVQNDGSTHEVDKLTPSFAAGLTHQEGVAKENGSMSSVTPLSSYSDDSQKQVVLYRVEKQTINETKSILECHACKLTFGDKDTYLQHQLSFHQRSAKRRRLGRSIGNGVIVKDGKYECQFCHKIFSERHRYNGHIGAHVRYQGLSAEALPDDITTRYILNPSPLAAVPYSFSEMTALAEQNEETCNAKSADKLHVDSSQCKIDTKNPGIDHNAKSGGSEATEVACTSISIDDQNNDHNLTSYKSNEILLERNITDDKSDAHMDAISPSVVDVNNVAQYCSPVTTQEASTSKSVDDQASHIDMVNCKSEVVEAGNAGDANPNDGQVNDCDMGGYKTEEVIEASNTKDVRPDASLDAVSSPLKNMDNATCESINEIGQSSSTSISVDNINEYAMTGYKSEEVVDINNPMGVKHIASIESISPSLINVDTNEIDLSSCTMIPEIGKYGTDQKANSDVHLITMSGNEPTYGIDTFANDIFTSSMGENVLVELDSSDTGLKTQFANSHSLSDKELATENIMPGEFNATCIDTTFVNGHNGDVETDADCTFDIDMKESVLEEMDKPDNELENCFCSSNAGCEEVVPSDVVANNDGTNYLQLNVVGTSSWVHSSDGVPILDMIPEQCEDELSSVGQKRGILPGFEELRLDASSSSEFVCLTGREPSSVPGPTIELGYATALQNGSCSSVQLGWDISRELTSVCVWCSREFSHGSIAVAELQPDSVGFMCPACKAKISG
uniref:Uncharacterized protein LOC105058428 isoform X2 n=1 Tax=Elaeis guineensis var. tenera TaxID=51953 RepID=A0A6I9S9J0_ELAGV|nr:uncharacterized protein LOC105058428 isoform X2 [Elaeis guineensis]